jgi:hypothetical protein
MNRIGNTIKGWFYLIREPRVTRLLQFFVYALLVVVGVAIILMPPIKFSDLLGFGATLIFGVFLTVGGILGSVGVFVPLPFQWVERAGIVALTVGWFIFLVIVVALGGTVAGFGFGAAFALMLTIRYLEIRPSHIPKQG